jgi:hypothetical protein
VSNWQQRRRLTAEEYSTLRWHAVGLAAGRASIDGVLAIGAEYRRRGVTWADIAAGHRAPFYAGTTDHAVAALRTRSILFAAGDAKPRNNDFAGEAAAVRAQAGPQQPPPTALMSSTASTLTLQSYGTRSKG